MLGSASGMSVRWSFTGGFIFFLLCQPSKPSDADKEWPGDSYGLPRPLSGCASTSFTWKTGWRFQDTEDKNPSNGRSASLHIDGLVRESSVNRSFCIKFSDGNDNKRPTWPDGQYCIYQVGNQCPYLLKPGYVLWDDENTNNRNAKEGSLPDGDYIDKNPYTTRIRYCCRNSGNKIIPITLPTNSPFYLMAWGSAECQQVKWTIATLEWIHFDTEGTLDAAFPQFPYGAVYNGGTGHTIHYCYYTSCKYNLTESTGVFQSPRYPHQYPDGQLCSWRITVPQGFTINVHFTNFSLNGTSHEDVLKFYDGINEKATLIKSYYGNGIPRDVTSSSNELFVVFRSDTAKSSYGFRAEYKTIDLTAPTTSTITTSNVNITNSKTTETRTTIATERFPTTTLATERFPTSLPPKATSKEQQTKHAQTDAPKPSNASSTFQPHRACLQQSAREVPVASIVVPLLCLIAVVAIAGYILYRWRTIRRNEMKNASIRYQAGPVENPMYIRDNLIKNQHSAESKGSIAHDDQQDNVYQEVQQQSENPLYDSSDGAPVITGNVLYE